MKKIMLTVITALMLISCVGCQAGNNVKQNDDDVYFRVTIRNESGSDLKEIRLNITRNENPVYSAVFPEGTGDLINNGEILEKAFAKEKVSMERSGNEVIASLTVIDSQGNEILCQPQIGFYLTQDIKYELRIVADSEGKYALSADFKHRDANGSNIILGNTIGMEVFQKIMNPNENICFSPLSLEIALKMLYEGARGETANQFASKLTSPLYIKTDKATIANSMWADDEFKVDPNYQDILTKMYEAEVFNEDLPGNTYKKINQWISDKTNRLIDGVFNEPLNDSMAMVLINALYFKANWMNTLNNLGQDEFTNSSGNKLTADYVGDLGNMLVAENDKWIGAVLPYEDGETSFIAFKSKDGSAAPDYQTLMEMISNAEIKYADLRMPKLDIEYRTDLKNVLTDCGLGYIFDRENADLSGIGTSEKGKLFVSMILQKTHLKLDENGTEAAAVTVIGVDTCAAPVEDPVKLYFDSSYFYAIVNNGAVMFVGYVDQPAAAK